MIGIFILERVIILKDFLNIRREIMENDFSRMNPVQKRAVFHAKGPLLILAGAGSGKTTVLVNRIANLIKYGEAYDDTYIPNFVTEDDVEFLNDFANGEEFDDEKVRELIAVRPVQPWQICAITFTNKAAGELKDRLINMLGEAGGEIWSSTFHASCARMLRRDADRIGYSTHFTVYDTDDQRRLMKDVQAALRIDEKILPHRMILGEISRAKETLMTPQDYMNSAGADPRKINIAKAYKAYQTRLKDADAMDFDDLLMNAVVLLRENEDILEYYQRRFKYIMVDEYQDTNHAQYMYVKMLADKHRNICVVGDDDQSIYKFRGATIENILSFERQYPDAQVIRLEQNYRSTQTILDAANAVISNNTERKGKNLWTDNGTGDKIVLHTADNEQAEAEFITDKILENVKNGYKYSDHAVLYRMNAQSNSIEGMLVRTGIPYRIIGGHRFYERKEIRDMIAYLSVIANPSDDVRLRRIINVPKRGIGDKTVSSAFEIAEQLHMSVFDVLHSADEFESLKRSVNKIKVFTDLLDSLIEAAENCSLHEIYEYILERTGYADSLKAEFEDYEDRIDNINELASNIVKYEEENGEGAELAEFLEEVSLMTDLDNYDTESDAVVLMTMHSAKGLEFPVVFLPGMEEGLFPGIQSIYNPKEVEEERRLAYVGITRAKKKLYISHASSRMLYGQTNRNRLSRFANEIPSSLIEATAVKVYYKEPEVGERSMSYVEKKMKNEEAKQRSINIGMNKSGKESYCVGEKVKHMTFGEGMILSAVPMGNDTMLEVAFDKVGTKKIMANFAKLKKI